MNRKKICFIATSPVTISSFLAPHIQKLSQEYEVFVVSNYNQNEISTLKGVTYIHIPLIRKIAPLSDFIVLLKLLSIFE